MKLKLAAIIAIISVGMHLYLTNHYHQLQMGASAGESSSCNINATFNCDAVAVSDYSAVFGIPVAAFGFSVNLVILFLLSLVLLRLTEIPEKALRAAFYISSFSVLASVAMGTISLTLLTALCLHCIALYVLSIVLFLLVWAAAKKEDIKLGPTSFISDFKGFAKAPLWPAVFALSIPVFALFLHKSIESNLREGSGKDFDRLIANSVRDWQSNPLIDFDHPPSLTKGSTQSSVPITIAEFADFRCGHCKKASPSLTSFAKANPDTQLHFYNFPLDGACNDEIPKSNGISCRLAKASHCGAEQKKGWVIHDAIFAHQESFYSVSTAGEVDKKIKSILGKENLDWGKLTQCMDSAETHNQIKKQTELAKRAGVKGTPKIFMNGRALPAGQLIPVLKRAKKIALSQQ